MPLWVRHSATWTAGQVPTLLSLAALGGLAVWGAANDWKLPSRAAGGPDPSEEEGSKSAIKVEVNRRIALVAGAVAAVAVRVRRIEFASAETVQKAGIEVMPARVQDVARYVTAPAMVDYEPSRVARLTARATGTVWRVDKRIGERVRKGEVLALVEAAEVGRYKADFLQSLAQVKTRATTLQQMQGAGKEGAVAEQSLLGARSLLREARIRLFNDQQALLNLGLPLRLRDVEDLPEDQLARHLRLLGLPEAVRRQLDPETVTANLLPLTAPFDGVVVQRNTAPGEVVQATSSRSMFVVADVSHLHIDLDVRPGDMAEVRPGQTVLFGRDARGPETARATVSHISPEVDEKTRRVQVHAEVANPDGRLRPNTFGTGRILVAEHRQVVVVPAAALQADGDTPLVFVRESEKRFQARPVRPGLRDGDLVEVRGVRPGEEVVTTGSFALKSELLKERIAGSE
jgi:cobalt-zinc-cadmium efflux system membrane fusion protein